MRACFLGMVLGVECARVFSVGDWVSNTCVLSRYGVRVELARDSSLCD